MLNNLKEIDSCEVCKNKKMISVLELGFQPMCDDLVEIGEDRTCIEYPIEILFCTDCCTAHQRFQIPKNILFPKSYHYRSRFTADVLKGMDDFVNSCKQMSGTLSGKKVLDIGCNDGSLLDFFRVQGAVTIGIEPTDAYMDAHKKGHVIFNDYLNRKVSEKIIDSYGKPDLITFTNVFAHIENLGEVIDSLKTMISPKTVIVIENHYLGAVIEKNQFDTFYHEHPRTYSYMSFVHIAKSFGLDLLKVEFPSRYGGNIRVYIGSFDIQGGTFQYELLTREKKFYSDLKNMQKNIESWRKAMNSIIRENVNKYGRIKAKAFPGRAAILIKLLGIDESLISAVYEKPGSMKIGKYVPGTRIPIRSDDDLFHSENMDLPLLNLAWHISGEIRGYLNEHGYKGPVIDILNPSEF